MFMEEIKSANPRAFTYKCNVEKKCGSVLWCILHFSDSLYVKIDL